MKTEKCNLLVWVFLLAGFLAAVPSFAQQSSGGKKKITIITQTTDENGETTTRTVVKEGDDAEDIDWNDIMENELEGDDVRIEVEEGSTAPETIFRLKTPHRDYMVVRDHDDDRAFLGVYTNTDSDGNLDITDIVENSGAAQAGLRSGDVLTGIAGTKISSYDDLIQALGQHKPGETVTVTYRRDDKEEQVQVQLGKRSEIVRQEVRWSDGEGKGGSFNWNDMEHHFDIKGNCEDLQVFTGESKPKLGVHIEDADSESKGVRITSVLESSAAAAAGLREGDIIYRLDAQLISDTDALVDAIAAHKPGDKVIVHFIRSGNQMDVEATLKEGNPIVRFEKGFPHHMEFFENEGPGNRRVIIRKSVDESEMPADQSQVQSLSVGDREFTLYPNPSNGVFSLQFKSGDKTPITVRVLDVNGKEVYQQEVADFNEFYKNDIVLDNQPDGSYILHIQQGDQIVTEKLVLQR